MDQIEDDLALAETSNALERLFGTDKAAPEASEEIYSYWDMLPEEIKHYILTLKHSQEMHEVIHYPLKRTLNREIKLYGIVLNEIQMERGSPRIKNISFKFGFNKREHELKYRQPDFACPFYSK